MAVVIPLNGCLYNPEVVKDMGKVLCPPYDMIGSDLHQELKSLSDYNVVHLEGGEQPDPETMEIDYRKASDLFQHWLKENILAIDSSPCFYLMQHGFEYRGEKLSQFGLFANVGLEDYESRIVFPHEFTREPAVQDRVALLEHSRAQFSPIMTNYRDSEQKLRDLYEHVTTTSPVFEVNDGVDGDMMDISGTYTVNDDMSLTAGRTSIGEDGFAYGAGGNMTGDWMSHGTLGVLGANDENMYVGGSYSMGAFSLGARMHTVTNTENDDERTASDITVGYTLGDNASLSYRMVTDDMGGSEDTNYNWLTLTIGL